MCHDPGRIADVDEAHGINLMLGHAEVTLNSVTFDADVDTGAIYPVVDFDFAAFDADGLPVNVDMGTFSTSATRGDRLTYIRFNLAKLINGTEGPGGEPDLWTAYATNDRDPTGLVDNGDGNFTYTFTTDIQADYDETATHRLALQLSRIPPDVATLNPIFDFVPDGSDVTRNRAIVSIDSCNECHGELTFHGGGRNDTRMCVVCHNPDEPDVDFPYMVHKIHAAQNIPEVHDYSEVTYPQDVINCRKCHNGDDEDTPDGDNWRTKPTMVACGACHNVSFVAPAPEGMEMHSAGPQPNNVGCAGCHPASGGLAGISDAHLTENPTMNNPDLPDGLANIAYELLEARVDDTNALEIDFSIMRDGVALDMLALPADLTEPARYPGFLLAYALVSEEAAESADYNNLGRTAAQPLSVSIGTLLADGNIVAAADAGVFTATIADGFPMGATLRAVGLQGYFNQLVDGENVARHTRSVSVGVMGDPQRREIVDPAKCANCHEWFEGHGGNRVYETMVCVQCHVPSLSSSGRAADPAGLPEATIEAVGDDPLMFPEDTNNFKDMIHGIHSAAKRDKVFEFVRNRAGGLYYDWSEVTFPTEASACMTCHYEDTYRTDAVPANALMSTLVTTDGENATREAVIAARENMPNATDIVSSPIAAACGSCHTADAAQAHFEQNGGIVARPRGMAAAN